MYNAHKAHMEYMEVRSESRSGFNLTEEELRQLNSVISPLLKKGQSLHHIMTHNTDSISCCEKTAYVYINNNLFDARNIDMPRVVRFRPRKKKSVELKVDKHCRIGRTYDDFNTFRENNPSLPVVELDSVEGVKGGAVLLTIHFVLPKLQLAFIGNLILPSLSLIFSTSCMKFSDPILIKSFFLFCWLTTVRSSLIRKLSNSTKTEIADPMYFTVIPPHQGRKEPVRIITSS